MFNLLIQYLCYNLEKGILMINTENYPILKGFFWYVTKPLLLTNKEVWEVYERNYRNFDVEELQGEEKELFNFLKKTEGNGLFLN